MRLGSLFSGIGGFDLGLERAGFETVWFCESDPFCRRVLERHWPGVPCYPDIRDLQGGGVEPVDALCGGFPCQDLSVAGRGAGIDGARSGLWREYARVIGELRPRFVFVENVPALLSRGFGRVLGDLAALGYDAEWDCLPACAFGAPHRRDRIWLIAYPRRESCGVEEPGGSRSRREPSESREPKVVRPQDGARSPKGPFSRSRAGVMAHSERSGLEGLGSFSGQTKESESWDRRFRGEKTAWTIEPDVGRMANGVPARVDRIRSLGNALVPQVAEWIGRRVMESQS